jgi:hypothetical protein
MAHRKIAAERMQKQLEFEKEFGYRKISVEDFKQNKNRLALDKKDVQPILIHSHDEKGQYVLSNPVILARKNLLRNLNYETSLGSLSRLEARANSSKENHLEIVRRNIQSVQDKMYPQIVKIQKEQFT